jgi:hypothetical protein
MRTFWITGKIHELKGKKFEREIEGETLFEAYENLLAHLREYYSLPTVTIDDGSIKDAAERNRRGPGRSNRRAEDRVAREFLSPDKHHVGESQGKLFELPSGYARHHSR